MLEKHSDFDIKHHFVNMALLKVFNSSSNNHLWVFGYGSLMWNPGFDYEEVQRAKVFGLHRAPCIYSWVHRGTRERPGIVLGLAQGGACIGKAFRIHPGNSAETLDYLRARELVTNVYLERHRKIILESGEQVTAVTYIADSQHEQYAGRLGHEALIAQIKGAIGKSGPNESYITDTNDHLIEMGIKDGLMARISQELKQA